MNLPLPLGEGRGEGSSASADNAPIRLPADATAASQKQQTNAPLRLWSTLTTDRASQSPTTRPQTRLEAKALASNAQSTHFAMWNRGQNDVLILSRDLLLTRIDAAEDHAFMILPLPGETPEDWRPVIDEASASLRLLGWLDQRVDEQQRLKDQQAAQAAQKQAEQTGRDNLRRAVWKALLGSDAPAPK